MGDAQSGFTQRQLDFASSSPSGGESDAGQLDRRLECKLPQFCVYSLNSDSKADVQYGGKNCDDNTTLFGIEPGHSRAFAGKHYDDVFTEPRRSTIFRNDPGVDNGACTNTLGDVICNECGTQIDLLEVLAYTGIYSQLLGALFAISRCKDSNNSILIHVLATGATAIAFSSMLAALIAFHAKCFQRYDQNTQHDYPDVYTFLGPSFALSVAATCCNVIQIITHLTAKHDRTCACACVCVCVCVRFLCCFPLELGAVAGIQGSSIARDNFRQCQS